jgi:hypothetical protein
VLGLSIALLVVTFAALRFHAPQPRAAPSEVRKPVEPVAAAPPPPLASEPAPQPPAAKPRTTPTPEARPSSARAEPPNRAAPVNGRTEAREEPAPVEGAREETRSDPTEADLFYDARLALEQGELERSRAILETLLSRNPSFTGAGELYAKVTDQIWETRLPLLLGVRHKHRLGGCQGELSLASLGVRFQSPDHDWAFRPADIRVMERPEATTFIVETFEKDTLSLGKNKRYRFDLQTPLSDADWARYQRLLK